MYSRYGNPYMRRWIRYQSKGEMAVQQHAATYKGVTAKSVLMVLLTIGVAIATELLLWFTIYNVFSGDINGEELLRLTLIGFAIICVASVAMMIGSIVLLFKPSAANVIGPIYCVLEGVFLGTMAGYINLFLPGVSLAALLGTGIVFLACLLLYKRLGARISNRFALGLVIGMLSFALVEVICLPIVYFLAASSGNIALMLGVQAGIALFCVIFASISVFWDIQNIDYMVKLGADKKFEWILAFSLTTSLIYLYVQILELLVRILALFGAKRKN